MALEVSLLDFLAGDIIAEGQEMVICDSPEAQSFLTVTCLLFIPRVNRTLLLIS